jgi:cellobiose-specific phosphotransferase system component IIB
VSGIPVDQRWIRTIAKVGGLVGKTVTTDESTKHNAEFVRIKIASRNVLEVPPIAEGTLELNLFDFHFKRETLIKEQGHKSNEGVKISKYGSRPSPKKQKVSHITPESKTITGFRVDSQEGGSGVGEKYDMGSSKSAPAKVFWEKKKDSEKMIVDEDEAIPAATYEPSDTSDDFQIQVNRVIGEEAESSKANNNRWLARCDLMNTLGGEAIMPNEMTLKRKKMRCEEKNQETEITKHTENEGGEKLEELDLSKLINPSKKMMEERKERIWSERILKLAEESSKGDGGSADVTHGGNEQNHNSFSVLSDHEIIERFLNMGVLMNNNNFDAINNLSEMKNSRMTLNNKTINTIQREKDTQSDDDKASEGENEEIEKLT